MKVLAIATAFGTAVALGGCTQPQSGVDANCAGAVLGGAAVGGIIGDQFGKGTGGNLMTAAGVAAGAAAGAQAACPRNVKPFPNA